MTMRVLIQPSSSINRTFVKRFTPVGASNVYGVYLIEYKHIGENIQLVLESIGCDFVWPIVKLF